MKSVAALPRIAFPTGDGVRIFIRCNLAVNIGEQGRKDLVLPLDTFDHYLVLLNLSLQFQSEYRLKRTLNGQKLQFVTSMYSKNDLLINFDDNFIH